MTYFELNLLTPVSITTCFHIVLCSEQVFQFRLERVVNREITKVPQVHTYVHEDVAQTTDVVLFPEMR